MSSRRATLLVCAVLVFAGSRAAPAQIDPFYLELEREGETAVARGDQAGAARLFRVACFGMLDEPDRLAACMVRLMKAQGADRDLEGLRASFLRLVTVEDRFQGLTRSGISLEEKQELARLVATRLPAELVAQIPELASLIAAEREAEKARSASATAKPKEKKRRGKQELPPPTAPRPTAEAAAPALPESSTEGAEVASALEESPRPQPVQDEELAPAAGGASESLPPLTSPSEQEILEAARRRSAQRPARSVVEADLAAVRAIADRNAGDVAAARLAGDLAYLLGSWPTCADYYQRAGDPGPERALERFYMAVCLFETGRGEAAARLIAPSADRLKRSPFVDDYLTRILDRATPP